MQYKGTQKQRVWLHNSHLGKAAMTRKMMQAIIASDSVTPQAAAIATSIANLSELLAAALKTRID